eukprot:CAMPEP_0171854966 /NCGR_PEP_ID=MMETSP0992-20121227/23192_1 /TAXON_ID=483369 /ORGANISM="non described non described, Strain CCMP2098" /LENGTH=54 /DNA_ID=CAMNT_0012475679 /DNA_START=40 /DNA_END=200 /DNA_ORIENTATION=+
MITSITTSTGTSTAAIVSVALALLFIARVQETAGAIPALAALEVEAPRDLERRL